jgi:serine/threonine-protein kinase
MQSEDVAELFLPEEARDPRIVERYHVVRLVGEGGMGRVFDARRLADGRRVAIKVLHRSLADCERSRQLMLREAHALAVAAHPLVVEFLQYGETSDGLPFLALEWLEGRSMHRAIVDEGPLAMPRVHRLFSRLLDALEVIHGRGIVHADLKPENCMLVTGKDGREDLRLVDFGVCSIGPEQCAPPGEVHGTPGYLAPEVLMGGPPSPQSDLYAAGIILFELLTGCAPFVASSLLDLVRQQMHQKPPLPSAFRPGVTQALDSVVARALAVDAARRYQSAEELRDAFRAAISLGKQRRVGAGKVLSIHELPTQRLVRRRRVPALTATQSWKAPMVNGRLVVAG